MHVDGSTYEGECGTPAHFGGPTHANESGHVLVFLQGVTGKSMLQLLSFTRQGISPHVLLFFLPGSASTPLPNNLHQRSEILSGNINFLQHCLRKCLGIKKTSQGLDLPLGSGGCKTKSRAKV